MKFKTRKPPTVFPGSSCFARTSPRATAFVSVVLVLVIAACSDRQITYVPSPSGEVLTICHFSAATASLQTIYSSDLTMHQSHGDYVAGLIVDKRNAQVGDSIHFSRIGDALARARSIRVVRNEITAGSCRITIAVVPGVFQGGTAESTDPAFDRFPLVFDMPDVTLRGSFEPVMDARGIATGSIDQSEATALVANPGLLTDRQPGGPQNALSESIIVINAHPEGSAGNGTEIEGFVFRSGNDSAGAVIGGSAITTLRAQSLVIRRNRIEGGFYSPLIAQVNSARIERNFLTGVGGNCGLCIIGPGEFQVTGNRLVGPGGVPGILILPAQLIRELPMVEQYVLPVTALVTVSVANNEVRNHQSRQSGAGLRIGAVGPGAPDVAGSARVTASDNFFVNNTFGVMVEAAFPVANTGLKSDIDLSLKGNVISGSCQRDLYVAFTRNSTGLGIKSGALFQTDAYLKNSTFTLQLGGDTEWKNAWYANPDGFGNTLMVDGQVIPNGSLVAYDAKKTCTP